MQQQLNEVAKALLEAKRIAIISHKNPDGDAVGSTLALCHYLRNIGKEAVVAMIDEEAGTPLTFSEYPRNSRYIPYLIQKMLKRIAEQK